MNILQAISDPAVFGSHFRGRATWRAWFAFLAALFGSNLTPEQFQVYRRCTNRTELPIFP